MRWSHTRESKEGPCKARGIQGSQITGGVGACKRGARGHTRGLHKRRGIAEQDFHMTEGTAREATWHIQVASVMCPFIEGPTRG